MMLTELVVVILSPHRESFQISAAFLYHSHKFDELPVVLVCDRLEAFDSIDYSVCHHRWISVFLVQSLPHPSNLGILILSSRRPEAFDDELECPSDLLRL